MAVVRVKLSDLATTPDALEVGGSDVISFVSSFTITNGDSIGSIYEIANVPSGYVPIQIQLNSAAVASCNDTDIGLYETEAEGGAVIDENILADALDFSAGIAIGSELNCLKDLTVAKIGYTFSQIAGDVTGERQSYTLAATINVAATGTGKVYVRGILVRG